jgi:hypothetical protein
MQDLSNLAAGSLNAESMAATNTVSTNTAMTAPGSASETTRDVDPGSPALDMAPYTPDAGRIHGDDPAPDASRWTDVSGRPWR